MHDLNFHSRRVLFLTRITRSSFGFMNLSVYALCYVPVYVLIARVFIAKVLYGRCPLTCGNGGAVSLSHFNYLTSERELGS